MLGRSEQSCINILKYKMEDASRVVSATRIIFPAKKEKKEKRKQLESSHTATRRLGHQIRCCSQYITAAERRKVEEIIKFYYYYYYLLLYLFFIFCRCSDGQKICEQLFVLLNVRVCACARVRACVCVVPTDKETDRAFAGPQIPTLSSSKLNYN